MRVGDGGGGHGGAVAGSPSSWSWSHCPWAEPPLPPDRCGAARKGANGPDGCARVPGCAVRRVPPKLTHKRIHWIG